MTEPFRFLSDVQFQTADIPSVAERIDARNRFVRDRFEVDVQRAGWLRLAPSHSLPDGATGLVIGVAVWSQRDLDFLARLATQVEQQRPVYIFDIDQIHSAEDLEHVMPGVSLPLETPVYAEYRAGRLLRSAFGARVASEVIGSVPEEQSS